MLTDIFAEKVLNSVVTSKTSSIVGFMAAEGRLYQPSRDLMVVGRAVNEWHHAIEPRKLAEPDARLEYTKKVLAASAPTGETCALQWVNDNWDSYTKKSQFWQLIKCAVEEMKISEPESNEWPSHIVWSNLYKIAPAQGGNPSESLCNLQFDACKQLLHAEIQHYSPRRILFLTHCTWANHFLEGISESMPISNYKYVCARGLVKVDSVSADYVVAMHPQTRPRDAMCEEIVHAFGR